MPTLKQSLKRAHFGLGAPPVVRNLFLFDLATAILAWLFLEIERPLFFLLIFPCLLPTNLTFFATALWMVYSSYLLKPRHLHRLISELDLKGDEEILDMGCGRGMFLCEAAKKVKPRQESLAYPHPCHHNHPYLG